MSIANLKSALPEYAKDLKLNIDTLLRSDVLNDKQKWGTLVACAAATRNATVLNEIVEEAREHLSDEEFKAAFAAASIMAMNNITYRAKGWLGDDYKQIRMGLRMNVISNPGVEKINFELWSLAVSSINGCHDCTIAHQRTVEAEGASKESVFESIKIAGTLSGIAQALHIEESLS